MSEGPKSRMFMVGNFVLCVGGALAFVWFAWGLEHRDSPANAWLQAFRDHHMVVIIALFALCGAVLVPWIWQETRGKEGKKRADKS